LLDVFYFLDEICQLPQEQALCDEETYKSESAEDTINREIIFCVRYAYSNLRNAYKGISYYKPFEVIHVQNN
jgi:hypothetical protein